MEIPKNVIIKENSPLAWFAAKKLKTKSAAIVFGNTIHLFGVNRQEFLQIPTWVRHELKHVEQYKQYGFLPFICRYMVESITNGYHNNCFEKEARNAENDK